MKTLVILHGWGSSKEKWQKVKENLENNEVNVIIPDLPGFKEKNKIDRPWNLDDYVNWLEDFSQNNEKFFLLGHSFGGAVALKFTLKHPQKVEKLFLVAASCIRRKTLKKGILAKISKIFKAFSFLPGFSILRKVFYRVFLKSDYPYTKGFMKETYLNIISEDLSGILPLIRPPTVIIWGNKDEATPIKDAHIIKDKIKNSELIVIPGGTHDLERKMPEKLSQTILSYCGFAT